VPACLPACACVDVRASAQLDGDLLTLQREMRDLDF
jgi:hypothetical protein